MRCNISHVPKRLHTELISPLISKIELDRATHCCECDEPVLKPIGGHLEKTTQSSVFVSKSYFEASEIGLQCSQYVLLDNSKHKYYSNYFVSFTVCFYCCRRRPYWRYVIYFVIQLVSSQHISFVNFQ